MCASSVTSPTAIVKKAHGSLLSTFLSEMSLLQGDLAFPWTLLEIKELFGACTIQAFKGEHRERAPQVGTVEKPMVKGVLVSLEHCTLEILF